MSLLTLFLRFLKVGSLSFGGHASLVAVLQHELSKDNQISEEEILNFFSVNSFLPGPVAVNVVSCVGFRLRGWLGGLIGTFAVLLPSFVLIIILAEMYSRFSLYFNLNHFIEGALPVIASIILVTGYKMLRSHVKCIWEYILLLGAFLLLLFFHSFLWILLLFTIGAFWGFVFRKPIDNELSSSSPFLNRIKPELLLGVVVMFLFLLIGNYFWRNTYFELLTVFSKMSLTLFGGGYVIIPMLHEILVMKLNWVNNEELNRAIIFGQVTPGPILVVASYLGYLKGGLLGAVVSTAAMFLPSSLVAVIVNNIFLDFCKTTWGKGIFGGLRIVSIGIIFYSSILLIDFEHNLYYAVAATFISFVILLKRNINYLLLILAGGLTGMFIL